MKISFVIPAHNEEHLLPKCIESIEKALASGSYDAEIIVVDNASTDRTGEVARAYPFVQVVEEPRKGLTRARQSGFDASTGDLIANIDADTIIPPGWIDTVQREFAKDAKLVAFSGPFDYYDLPPIKRFFSKIFISSYPLVHYLTHRIFRVGAMLQGGNFVLRRDALIAAGGFDTTIVFYGEDSDIARRISKFGKVTWTLRLPILASGRRLLHEGLVRSGFRYAVNFFSTNLSGKPWDKEYTDIRPQHRQIIKNGRAAAPSVANAYAERKQ